MRLSMDSLMTLLMLSDLVLLGTGRLALGVRVLALQGLVLGVLPFVTGFGGPFWQVTLFVAVTVAAKSVFFPILMRRLMRDAEVRREEEPPLGYSMSLALGVVALAVSFWLGSRLPVPGQPAGALALPSAMFGIFTGLMLIVLRRKAVTQVMGYLAMENGIYVAGVSLLGEFSLLVELGILLDLFVGVFLMGIIIFHIHRAFDHIDTDQLTALKDWSGT